MIPVAEILQAAWEKWQADHADTGTAIRAGRPEGGPVAGMGSGVLAGPGTASVAPGFPSGGGAPGAFPDWPALPLGQRPEPEPGRAPAALPRLEAKGNKVTFPENGEKEEGKESFFRGVACQCKNWMCSTCKRERGYKLRERLQAKADQFKAPRLFTVTVNRAWFPNGPESAYLWVMRAKFLPRLLTKELGIRSWVWVMEPQAETGDGFPHWHILMDVSGLPGRWYNATTKEARAKEPANKAGWVWISHFVDLARVHRLLRNWTIGEQCELSQRRGDFASPEHAINYITKYLVKEPKRGYPPWMQKHPRIRFVQASRALGALVSNAKRKAKRNVSTVKRSAPRQPFQRIAECRRKLAFVGYDPQADRAVFVKPFFATKESLKEWSAAEVVFDHDFEADRDFPIWGFSGLAGVWQFQDQWAGERLEALRDEIRQRETELLNRWARDAVPEPVAA